MSEVEEPLKYRDAIYLDKGSHPLFHMVLESVIGQGGFGITYKGYNLAIRNRRLAVKEFYPITLANRDNGQVHPKSHNDQFDFDEGLKRFRREAEILASIKHPSVVNVYGLWSANNTAYMEMEYIEGVQWKFWRENYVDRFDQKVLKKPLLCILEALETIHNHVNHNKQPEPIYHRDISPDNILMSHGLPVLIDFGAAKQVTSQKSKSHNQIVKDGFSPPELYGFESAVGPYTDIYALSAVLYWTITGKCPPNGLERMMAKVDPYQKLSEHKSEWEDFSPQMLQAIDWGLALDFTERPQSVAQWREALFSINSSESTVDSEQITQNKAQTRTNFDFDAQAEANTDHKSQSKEDNSNVHSHNDTLSTSRQLSQKREKNSRTKVLILIAGLLVCGFGLVLINPTGESGEPSQPQVVQDETASQPEDTTQNSTAAEEEKIKRQLEQMKQEKLENDLYGQAKATRAKQDLENYLEQFPTGQHVPEVRQWLIEEAFDQAQQRDTEKAYQDFIRNYPDSGDFLLKAQNRLKELTQWHACQSPGANYGLVTGNAYFTLQDRSLAKHVEIKVGRHSWKLTPVKSQDKFIQVCDNKPCFKLKLESGWREYEAHLNGKQTSGRACFFKVGAKPHVYDLIF